MDSAATLVARFLRTNDYHETLDAFLREANLPADTGASSRDALSIEQVLKEKSTFDLSNSFEKVTVDSHATRWSLPAPTKPIPVSMHSPSNILHVGGYNPPSQHTMLLASAADKSILNTRMSRGDISAYSSARALLSSQESPILSWTILFHALILTTSMSGSIALHRIEPPTTLWSRRDHQKYVVAVASSEDSEGSWVATAAWDAKIYLYRFSRSAMDDQHGAEPIASVTLPSNPESLLFVCHPDIDHPVLLLSRKDSTFLYYYEIPANLFPASEAEPTTTLKASKIASLPLLGRQNLAPHSNAWIAFTPSALALHPHDPSMLAVATSHVPHMKLIIVKLLFPSPKPPSDDDTQTSSRTPAATQDNYDNMTTPSILDATTGPIVNPTQASEARRLLAIQDREAAAIQLQMSTLAPQTAYSTPALVWRPDGTGVWVNGDDGVVRGVEASSGKVVKALRDGHEAGSKVRCLWAGEVEGEDGKLEVLVSGGFDRRLIVWECDPGDT